MNLTTTPYSYIGTFFMFYLCVSPVNFLATLAPCLRLIVRNLLSILANNINRFIGGHYGVAILFRLIRQMPLACGSL